MHPQSQAVSVAKAMNTFLAHAKVIIVILWIMLKELKLIPLNRRRYLHMGPTECCSTSYHRRQNSPWNHIYLLEPGQWRRHVCDGISGWPDCDLDETRAEKAKNQRSVAAES